MSNPRIRTAVLAILFGTFGADMLTLAPHQRTLFPVPRRSPAGRGRGLCRSRARRRRRLADSVGSGVAVPGVLGHCPVLRGPVPHGQEL